MGTVLIGWSVLNYLDHCRDDANYNASVVSLSRYCRSVIGRISLEPGSFPTPPQTLADLISAAYPERERAEVGAKEQLIKRVGTLYVRLPKDIEGWSFQNRDVVIAYVSKGPKSVTTVFLISGEHFKLLPDR